MIKKIKAQFALEFVIIVAFMMVVFLGFFSLISSKIFDLKSSQNQQITKDIALIVNNEVKLAETAANGYIRNFIMPGKIERNNYSLRIIDNRELVVNYLDNEYVLFLPDNVRGTITLGTNTIRKQDDIIYISPCLNCDANWNICLNAHENSLCDGLDIVYGEGYKSICCRDFALCCA